MARKEPKVPFKKKKLQFTDDIKDFIFDEKLVASDRTPIPASMIYMRYVKWCELHSITVKGVSYFFGRFKLYFNSKLTGNIRYYYLSPEGFDLSAANIESVQNDYKQRLTTKKAKSKRKA